jgi:hypothetical protein
MITPEMLAEAKARIDSLVTQFGDEADRAALNVFINAMDDPKITNRCAFNDCEFGLCGTGGESSKCGTCRTDSFEVKK